MPNFFGALRRGGKDKETGGAVIGHSGIAPSISPTPGASEPENDENDKNLIGHGNLNTILGEEGNYR